MLNKHISITDKGLKRKVNQDCIFENVIGDNGIFVVADGMGGHSKGEMASHYTCDNISKWWELLDKDLLDTDFEGCINKLKKVVLLINTNLYETYSLQNEVGGTTLCVLIIHKKRGGVVWVGDSRVYMEYKGSFEQITVDDVWENDKELTEGLTEYMINNSPERGKLTQAVGGEPDVDVHHKIFVVEKKSYFLMCSDGIYKYLNGSDMEFFFNRIHKMLGISIIKKMIINRVLESGAGDNYSLILLKL